MKKKNATILIGLLVLAAAIPTARWCIERSKAPSASGSMAKQKDYYYCPMHPWFHQDNPGNCGICGMTLIEKESGAEETPENVAASTSAPAKRKIEFWVNPMDPSVHSNVPMKDSMGMDYVPVYEDQVASLRGESAAMPEVLKGLAKVDLSPFKQQLIGLRTAVAEKKPVVRVVRTVGRFAGGEDDFPAAVGDFAANGTAGGGGGRYLVADVYELDIPYVKVGQRAWVSSFSGSGPRVEGRVAEIYPYDGTQSRIRRVKISLPQAPASELFANVEIEAASQPLLSVPQEAVLSTGLHRYVFVKKSETAYEPREVTVGFQGDEDCQVTSGLSAGETLVVGANFLLDVDSKLAANFAAMESESK